ncbi:DUF262 domain-containing protein [Mucilaginibacter sp. SJ]|uniref:DUF262 domain-containing protein n=1 Tax=Mucilaginibacter sp. SJ TaxID=3029053 RepID=UPI0023A9E837|nr:DUF262 domain-containing protein [Mucilaginibacter sp. SJ]WEA00734.1 DUF262 domain-containing protein [Mucilaginibacter sp. SJ]
MRSENEIFENDDDRLELDIPKEERYLNTSSYDYSVEFIVSMMIGENPKVILEVPFQRQYVWKDDKASQLVESIIMNVPIPPIYFAEEEDGRWLVIDGLQRLNALLKYFQNEYGLKKLDILKDLERMKIKDLPPKAKSLLANGQLRVNVIKKDSHQDIKYDIFMRLNKGAVTLNYQELRNCLYRGSLNDLAKEIVQSNSNLLSILNLRTPQSRFLDVEFVIRIFAMLSNLDVDENGDYYLKGYTGRLVTYINNYMSVNRKMPIESIKKLHSTFNETLNKVVVVFGTDKAFRDISENKSKVNKALADCIVLAFSLFDEDKLKANKASIQKHLVRLLNNDQKFKSSISLRTSDKDVMNYRIDKWIKTLKDAL